MKRLGLIWMGVAVLALNVRAVDLSVVPVEVDSDGDGFTDRQELAWGTNPRDPNNYPDLVSKLAAWWPLDEARGTTVADVSGNARNGTLAGAQLPVWTADVSGAALQFDGRYAQVTIAAGKELTPTNVFTLAAWVKLTPGTTGTMFLRAGTDAKSTCYSLGVAKNKLALQVTLHGELLPLYGHLVVADGDWHYVVCSYNGYELRLFVDGAKDVTVFTGGAVLAVDGPLVLGRIAGSLRDVAVYARALKECEVILLHEVVSQEARGPASLAEAGQRRVTVARGPKTPAFLYAAVGARPGQPVLVKADVPRRSLAKAEMAR